MRAMRIKSLAWLISAGLLVGLALPSEISHAEKKPAESKKPTAQAVKPAMPLSSISSFGIHDMEPNDFSTKRDDVPQELVEYARAALQKDTRLSYDSPAQGLLRLRCDNDSCSRIRAEVTYGEAGPVVWQTVQQYRRCPFVEFRFLPDGRKFSEKIIQQLGNDYQQSIKAVPVKIQIGEE